MALTDAAGRICAVVTSIPSGFRSRIGALRDRIGEFEKAMGRNLDSAGRRGDFKCAEYGISFGGGQKVRVLIIARLSVSNILSYDVGSNAVLK